MIIEQDEDPKGAVAIDGAQAAEEGHVGLGSESLRSFHLPEASRNAAAERHDTGSVVDVAASY